MEHRGEKRPDIVESFDEIRNNREYLFYILVSRDFAQTAKQKLRNLLRKLIHPLNSEEPNLVPVKFSPTGERPATHFGMRIQIRGKEAFKAARYANNADPNDLFVWLLNLNSEPLWTKGDGFNPPQVGPKPHRDFIQEQNLKVIRD